MRAEIKLLIGIGATLIGLFFLLIATVIVDDYFTTRSNVMARYQNAENGDLAEQYTLGGFHLTGENEYHSCGLIRKDNQKALYWLGRAARGGYVDAYAYYAIALERDGQKAEAGVWTWKALRARKSH